MGVKTQQRQGAVAMNFKKWLETFIEEKGFENELFEVEYGMNKHFIEMGVLVNFLSQIPRNQQESVKTTLVKIDFMNGDVMHFLRHLAKGYIETQYSA